MRLKPIQHDLTQPSVIASGPARSSCPTQRPWNPGQTLAGFTLVELLIGMSLSLLIMGGVLSSYTFLARNFTRSLGITSANQPNLEAQARRTLGIFNQDVRMARGLAGPPGSSSLALAVPMDTGTKIVNYYFNDTAAAVTVNLSGYNTTIPALSLTRVDGSTGATQMLHSSLLTCTFSYFDATGSPYTIFDSANGSFSSLSGIKQLALTFAAQAGSSANGTRTQVYELASPRLLLRNKTLLP